MSFPAAASRPAWTSGRARIAGALLLLGAGFAALYGAVLVRLIHDWATDDNYSHGFLVVPLAAYFAWQRRARLIAATPRPSPAGLLIVVLSVAGLIAGTLGAELFVSRASMLGVVAGTILFMLGWAHLRILIFPIAFLLLMIPIPAIIFTQIAFPLQLQASRIGASTLAALNIPVLRQGNVIVLAHTTLEVAEACSGIRSLISLLTLGIAYVEFTDQRLAARIAFALATIPVAVAANSLRVAGTGVAAHYFGSEAAEGFYHTFAGWLVFVVALGMLFMAQRILFWVAPPRGEDR